MSTEPASPNPPVLLLSLCLTRCVGAIRGDDGRSAAGEAAAATFQGNNQTVHALRSFCTFQHIQHLGGDMASVETKKACELYARRQETRSVKWRDEIVSTRSKEERKARGELK